ncbi:hypothetical protein ACQP3F_28905, partial [Escherichia coli]
MRGETERKKDKRRVSDPKNKIQCKGKETIWSSKSKAMINYEQNKSCEEKNTLMLGVVVQAFNPSI